MWKVVTFATVLAAVQLVEGTTFAFVFGTALYIVIAALAFNVAGGMNRPSGNYIFFNTSLTLIVGVVAKAVMGEAGETNLRSPDLSILAYVGTAIALLIAAYLTKIFRRRKGLLEPLTGLGNSRAPAVGCLIVGGLLPFAYEMISESGAARVASALGQLNKFVLLSIILSTYNAIEASKGRRATNWIVMLGCAYNFYFLGVLSYSKEGLFTPFVAWVIVCAAMRFNFKLTQIAVFSALLGFTIYYMVPYAQVGRASRDDPGSVYEKAAYNLGRLDEMRQIEEEYTTSEKNSPHFFAQAGTLTERLQMIAMDDALVDLVQKEGTMGYFPIESAFLNLIPHFIWPEKPFWVWGNVYAHRIGMLGDDDDTTGISFSAVGEAFIVGGWGGIFMLLPVAFTCLFIITDSVAGEVGKSPWGLFYTMLFAHYGPEGMVQGTVAISTMLTGILILGAYTSVYFMSLVGLLITPRVRVISRPLQVTPGPKGLRKEQLGEA